MTRRLIRICSTSRAFARKDYLCILSLRPEALICYLVRLPHETWYNVVTRQVTQKDCAQSELLPGIISVFITSDKVTDGNESCIYEKIHHDPCVACSRCASEYMNIDLLCGPEYVD